MELKEEKVSATRQTLNYLEKPSKFSYYDGIEIRLSDQSRMLDNATIEKMVLLNEVVESDFFILKALAELSWANVEMLTVAVNAMHKREPEKAIPPATRDTIKSRVVRLCKASLAKGFEYKTASDTPIKVYCATDAGIMLIRRKLYYDGYCEIFNALNPAEEIFRRLACNYVAQRLSVAPTVTTFLPGMVDYVPGIGKVYLFSRIFCDNGEKKKATIFEPLYFRSNPLLISKKDMYDYIENRFKIIRALEKKLTSDDYYVSIVFVVEDFTGLKEGLQLVLKEFSDWYERVFLTSENAVYSSDNIVRAFLKISELNEGKPTLMACSSFSFL